MNNTPSIIISTVAIIIVVLSDLFFYRKQRDLNDEINKITEVLNETTLKRLKKLAEVNVVKSFKTYNSSLTKTNNRIIELEKTVKKLYDYINNIEKYYKLINDDNKPPSMKKHVTFKQKNEPESEDDSDNDSEKESSDSDNDSDDSFDIKNVRKAIKKKNKK